MYDGDAFKGVIALDSFLSKHIALLFPPFSLDADHTYVILAVIADNWFYSASQM